MLDTEGNKDELYPKPLKLKHTSVRADIKNDCFLPSRISYSGLGAVQNVSVKYATGKEGKYLAIVPWKFWNRKSWRWVLRVLEL
jgi:hypothetical protein